MTNQPVGRENDVLRLADVAQQPIKALLSAQGMTLVAVPDNEAIPGSHWGDDEAGLIGSNLYARQDTPVHSVLHEACHYFVMDDDRRAALHTNAGGSAVEESAVCYLQIRLADRLPGVGAARICTDMDRWGYSFRLGSTRAWFENDAEDAVEFLQRHGFWSRFDLSSIDTAEKDFV